MTNAKADALTKSVAMLLAEKDAVAAKERALLAGLRAALAQLGYDLVPRDSGKPRERRRRRERRGSERPTQATRRRRGMSAAARKAVSRRMKAYWAKRKAVAANGKGTRRRK